VLVALLFRRLPPQLSGREPSLPGFRRRFGDVSGRFSVTFRAASVAAPNFLTRRSFHPVSPPAAQRVSSSGVMSRGISDPQPVPVPASVSPRSLQPLLALPLRKSWKLPLPQFRFLLFLLFLFFDGIPAGSSTKYRTRIALRFLRFLRRNARAQIHRAPARPLAEPREFFQPRDRTQQFAGFKRLHNVRVGPGRRASSGLKGSSLPPSATRNTAVSSASSAAGTLPARCSRHVHVQHDQIRFDFSDSLQRSRSVVDRDQSYPASARIFRPMFWAVTLSSASRIFRVNRRPSTQKKR